MKTIILIVILFTSMALGSETKTKLRDISKEKSSEIKSLKAKPKEEVKLEAGTFVSSKPSTNDAPKLTKLQEGPKPTSAGAHSTVTTHYGIISTVRDSRSSDVKINIH